jgi:sulfotransferase family protein
MIDFITAATGSPVIVCGNPRSGTRMHADALNAHPDVLITDEFHHLGQLRAILSDFRRNSLLKKFSREQALARQTFLAKMLWLSCSVDRTAERGFTARIIGNKTPKIERHYKILENMFIGAPPRYVYCLRSAPKVLRSVKNLPNLRWNRDSIETNLKRYIASVRFMEEMTSAFPERICVSVIDHLRPGTRNSDFFERIFRFIGVELTNEVRLELDGMSARNTMDVVKRETKQDGPIVELTDEEMDVILNSPEYDEISKKYDLEPVR